MCSPCPPPPLPACYPVLQVPLDGYLTVRETLQRAAALRVVGRRAQDMERHTRVEQVWYWGTQRVVTTIPLASSMVHESALSWVLRLQVMRQLGLLPFADAVLSRPTTTAAQRRLVAIGCELLARPALLLLDDACSGLSAGQVRRVATSLRVLTACGSTVVASMQVGA